MTHTIDDFLGGKIKLKQPKEGLRATSDAVLVAAAVPAKSGQTVLDVGCGTGVVALSIAARVKDLQLIGVEIQPEIVDLARENAALNNADFTLIEGNVAEKISALHGKQFHHIVTNPPFYTEDPRRIHPQVDIAYKQDISLEKWIDFCLRYIRPKGTFTMIHRMEAVPEILGILNGRLGDIHLIPIYPKAGTQPKRVIIQGTLGSKKPFTLHAGVVMHNEDGSRSQLAEDIMRAGKRIV